MIIFILNLFLTIKKLLKKGKKMNQSRWNDIHKTWATCPIEEVYEIKDFLGYSHEIGVGTNIINQDRIGERFEKTPRVFIANNKFGQVIYGINQHNTPFTLRGNLGSNKDWKDFHEAGRILHDTYNINLFEFEIVDTIQYRGSGCTYVFSNDNFEITLNCWTQKPGDFQCLPIFKGDPAAGVESSIENAR